MGEGAAETPYPPGLLQEWFGTHVFNKLNPHHAGFWLAMLATVVLFFAILAGLQRLGSGARRRLTYVCTFLAGLIYLLAFILPPGNSTAGVATIGGRPYKFTADITWAPPDSDEPKPDEAAKAPEAAKGGDAGKAAPKEEKPPQPAVRHLKGKIITKEAPKGAKGPDTGEEALAVSGQQKPDGTWDLKITDKDGNDLPVTQQGAAYGFTLGGEAGTLAPRAPRAYNLVKAYESPMGQFMLVMGGFTIGLGLTNLCAVHGRTLLRGQRGWHNSLAFFVGLFGMTIFGLWQLQLEPTPKTAAAIPFAKAGYELFFSGLLKPLQSTTFALLGFFIVSAAYRAFRIRSTEAALMTIIAFVVMLGQVPLGQMLTAWLPADGPISMFRIERITNWLLTTPNTAATRGILFGSVAGGFALSLRVWLSLERGSYFGKEF